MTGPIATNVQVDDLGAACRDCLTDVYLVRIDLDKRWPSRVPGKPVYRHRERKPPCLFDAKGRPR